MANLQLWGVVVNGELEEVTTWSDVEDAVRSQAGQAYTRATRVEDQPVKFTIEVVRVRPDVTGPMLGEFQD